MWAVPKTDIHNYFQVIIQMYNLLNFSGLVLFSWLSRAMFSSSSWLLILPSPLHIWITDQKTRDIYRIQWLHHAHMTHSWALALLNAPMHMQARAYSYQGHNTNIHFQLFAVSKQLKLIHSHKMSRICLIMLYVSILTKWFEAMKTVMYLHTKYEKIEAE